VIEQLGSEMLVEARAGEASLTVARVDPQSRLSAGDKVRLSCSRSGCISSTGDRASDTMST